MAKVQLCNITVMDNPSPFLNPFQFEITFECIEELKEGKFVFQKLIKFKLFYLRFRMEDDLRRLCRKRRTRPNIRFSFCRTYSGRKAYVRISSMCSFINIIVVSNYLLCRTFSKFNSYIIHYILFKFVGRSS